MKRILIAALLSCAPAVGGLATVAVAAETVTAPEVSLDELKKLVESKGATIVDVNAVKMYKEGHIPGAVNYSANEKNFASVLPKEKNGLIVAYCGGPMCTAWQDAAKAAKELGYTNIKHSKGGIKGWKDAGQKTDKGA